MSCRKILKIVDLNVLGIIYVGVYTCSLGPIVQVLPNLEPDGCLRDVRLFLFSFLSLMLV